MKALWQIILAILWRLRPVQALEVNIGDVIGMGLAMFRDDDEIAYMLAHPDHCARLAAGLADAHAKIDLMIYLRACELTGQQSRARGFAPNFTCTAASATPDALWRSLARLIIRFNAYERTAAKRAERLRREAEENPIRLDTEHHLTLCADRAASAATPAILASNTRRHVAAAANDSLARRGACMAAHASAHARGPPSPSHSPKPKNASSQSPAGSRPCGLHAPNIPATRWPSLSRTTITNPPSGSSSIRKSDSAPPSEMISRRACSASRRVLKRGRPFEWGITGRHFVFVFGQGRYLAT